MPRVIEKLVILSILCIILEFDIATGAKWTRTSQSLNIKPEIDRKLKLISDKDNFADQGFIYGACAYKHSSNSTCNLFMETNKAVGSPEHVCSCNFTLELPENFYVVRVAYLDDDTAVILSQKYLQSLSEDPSSRLTIVRFSDCKTRIVELGHNVSRARIAAPFNRTFDLIDVRSCGDGYYNCRMTIDFNGTIVTKAYKWIPEDNMNYYAAIRSPTEGLVVVSSYANYFYSKTHLVLEISAVNDDQELVNPLYREAKVLKKYPVDSPFGFGSSIAYSSSHRLLSACGAVNLTARCAQFDHEGRLKFETTINVVEPACLRTIKMFNLQQGGFLFLYTDCFEPESKIAQRIASYTNVFVTKVNFLGQKFKTLKLTQFTGTDVLEKMHFFVNEKKEYCLSQPYYEEQTLDKTAEITLEIVCFGQNEIPIQMMGVGVSQ